MGGQSIPNFDYAMAEGVAKTFRRNFLEKLIDAIDERTGGKADAELTKATLETVEKITGEQPRLDKSIKFDRLLSDFNNLPKEVIQRVRRRATEKTERDTYQAMEAFVHNMNTLQSKAGSQVKIVA